MEFKAIPRTIGDTLELKRRYIIPRFQREYSWESDELNELWDDLLDNIQYKDGKLAPSEYFIGSLVLVGDDDDNINIDRQVVDGQQRLMTITIAFSVLSQLFLNIGENKLSEKMHLYIMGEDTNGDPYTKLLSETPKPFFQYRIQMKNVDTTRVPSTQEEKRILAAYLFFERKLTEKNILNEILKLFQNSDIQITYVDALKLFRDQILNCKVIYVTVKSFEDGYAIFEVLNAKGKDLTPVDMIKNSLFSILNTTEPLDFADEKWKSIRNSISKIPNGDMLVFYRHYWLSKYNFSTTKRLVKEFNEQIEKNQISYEKFLLDLEVASMHYYMISAPSRIYWKQPEELQIYSTYEALDIFGVIQVRTFLLALTNVKMDNKISHKEYIKILKFLEYFHFVFNAICSSRPSGLERRYSSYARKLRECSNKSESKRCIRELINVLLETIPTYDYFENAFLRLRFTSVNTKDKKLVQYILRKLETYSSKTMELQPLSFTIEHILSESARNDECGMIGNLLPLGEKLNNEIQDKNFKYKIERYAESAYKSVSEFLTMYGGSEEWNEGQIIDRTKYLAKILYDNMSK